MNKNKKKYPHLQNEEERLRKTCMNRLTELYGELPDSAIVVRLDKELDTINEAEMTGVFLILWQLIIKSKLRSYEMVYDGCLGVSLVAYLIGLTEFDPLKTRVPFYPELLFGIHWDNLPVVELRVPNGMADILYEKLQSIEGVGAVKHAYNEDGMQIKYGRMIIPDGIEPVRGELQKNSSPFYRILFVEDQSLNMLGKLADETGFSPDTIRLDDPEVLTLYQMEHRLEGFKEITSFEDAVRVDALIHGTRVWEDNLEPMVQEGIIDFSHIITSREEIYEYVQNELGLSKEAAFTIMDSVGKGRGFPDQLMIREGKENSAELLQDKDWFVRFCDQVIYMFPRVHCYGHVRLSWRLTWYHLHFFRQYYRATLKTWNC